MWSAALTASETFPQNSLKEGTVLKGVEGIFLSDQIILSDKSPPTVVAPSQSGLATIFLKSYKRTFIHRGFYNPKLLLV